MSLYYIPMVDVYFPVNHIMIQNHNVGTIVGRSIFCFSFDRFEHWTLLNKSMCVTVSYTRYPLPVLVLDCISSARRIYFRKWSIWKSIVFFSSHCNRPLTYLNVFYVLIQYYRLDNFRLGLFIQSNSPRPACATGCVIHHQTTRVEKTETIKNVF